MFPSHHSEGALYGVALVTFGVVVVVVTESGPYFCSYCTSAIDYPIVVMFLFDAWRSVQQTPNYSQSRTCNYTLNEEGHVPKPICMSAIRYQKHPIRCTDTRSTVVSSNNITVGARTRY